MAQQLHIELINERKNTAHEQKDTSNQSTSTTDLQHDHEEDSLLIDKPKKLFYLDDGHYHLAVCTENGNILATEWSTHGISVFNCEGKKIGSLLKHQLKNPCGVAISIDDHILVTDEHRLQKLKTDGTCVKSLGSSKSGCGELEFNHPKGIAVHPHTGLIFVTDSGNERIQVFTKYLAICYTINMIYPSIPRDVAYSKECLYVADDGNNCVTKLTVSGECITHFGSYGSAHGQIHSPSALTVINDLVYVTELSNHRVSVFNTEGNYLYCFGEKSNGGEQDEIVYKDPWGIATDESGHLYVSDFGNMRIIVY